MEALSAGRRRPTLFGCVNKTSRRRNPEPQGRGGIASPLGAAPAPPLGLHIRPHLAAAGRPGGRREPGPGPSPSPGRRPGGGWGRARVGRPGLGLSPRRPFGPQPPGLGLDRRAEQPVRDREAGPRVRELDPPGRRGRGGARGAGSAGARPPPPFIQPSPGAEGLRRPALHGGSAGAAPPSQRAGPGPAGALPCRSPPRIARPASHHVRPRGQRAAGRHHFGLRRWVRAGHRAAGVLGGPSGRAWRGSRARTGRRDFDGRPRPLLGGPRSGNRGDRAPSPAPMLALRAAAEFPSFYCCLCLPSDDSLVEGARGFLRRPGRSVSLSAGRSVLSLPRSPPAAGAPALRVGGVGYLRDSPLPAPVSGPGPGPSCAWVAEGL